jgi:hypothetical protein
VDGQTGPARIRDAHLDHFPTGEHRGTSSLDALAFHHRAGMVGTDAGRDAG